MTFHMEQTQLKQRINYEESGLNRNFRINEKNMSLRETDFTDQSELSRKSRIDLDLQTSPPQVGLQKFEKRIPFPQRLWDAINDTDTMITWTADGRGVLVDEVRFQNKVMSLYPGFVQVSNFNNLRRQLRVYNFDWQLMDDHTDNIVFYHPCFQRGHPELLPYVFTKRRITRPTKRRRDETCSDTDQSEAALPEDSPNSAEGVPTRSRHKRRYKRRKPLKTETNHNIPDSKESVHDDKSTAKKTIGQSRENPQNLSVTGLSKNPTEKLNEKSPGAYSISLPCGRPGDSSAEFESDCKPLARPCEKDVIFEGGMRNNRCDCMINSKLGEGDCAGGGAPIYLKNCSFSECCNHTCGHCNAPWASKPSIDQPSQRGPYYFSPHSLGRNNRAPQERYFPTTPYGYHFMAPMMPPISPQYVIDPNMINTPRHSPLSPVHTMMPANQAVSNAADGNQMTSNNKTVSSPQSPVQECSNPPKTYHRLESVPDAMSWHTGRLYNEAYHNYVTGQKLCRYEKPVTHWCWNIAPESHAYQIPHNPSPNIPNASTKTYVMAKTDGSSTAPRVIEPQTPEYIPQSLQVKPVMPVQCGQLARGKDDQSKNREGTSSIPTRIHTGLIRDVKLERVNCNRVVTPSVTNTDEKKIDPSTSVHSSQSGNHNATYEDNKCAELSRALDKGNHLPLEVSNQDHYKKYDSASGMAAQKVSYVADQIMSLEETEPIKADHTQSIDEGEAPVANEIVSYGETETAIVDRQVSHEKAETSVPYQVVSNEEAETAIHDQIVSHNEIKSAIVDEIVSQDGCETAVVDNIMLKCETAVVDNIASECETVIVDNIASVCEIGVVDDIASYEEVGVDYSEEGEGLRW